ncbi:MAG: ApaG protein [Planctomycetota bacterium]|jgi:ApaG protein
MTSLPHSDRTTDGIRIFAAAEFMPQEALPREFNDPSFDDDRDAMQSYVFRYKITMTNVGADEGVARLLSRHWLIVDGEGQREEVRGRGVVGEYPSLAAGESYSYVSYCPLPTAWGTMEGSYTFEREDGTRFDVAIDRFFLVPSAPPLKLEPQSH